MAAHPMPKCHLRDVPMMTGQQSEFHVRTANMDALDGVMRVMKGAFDPEFGEAWTAAQCSGMLSLNGTALFTLTAQDQLAGFAITRAAADEVELLLIAVDPAQRGRGAGAMLVEAARRWATEQMATRLFLEVRRGNPAIALYEARGFKTVGARKDYYRGINGQHHDALTMALVLK